MTKLKKSSAMGEPITPEQAEQDQLIVKAVLRPSVSAGVTLHALRPTGHELQIDALIAELLTQVTAVVAGKMDRMEGYLAAQVITLDGLFNSLARRAALNMGEYVSAAETYLRLALKAQAQCRATVESLGNLKNPRPVAYVGQVNNANGPQQVNNSRAEPNSRTSTGAHAGARENEIQLNRLLEQSHGERLDTSTAGTAVSPDTQLETVGAIHGTKDGPR